MASQTPTRDQVPADVRPWPALFALCLGFFMILVDTTIVSVATPAIISDLHADVNSVVWVTSAYLLAYAVLVLITGRLGDRYGPKNLYLLGLTVFTLASLWCGFTTTIEMLIVARVVQGVGAALLTPQTMSVITRIFPSDRRGQAMALWGATAGVATLVGPILGGILVDGVRLGVDLLHQHPGRRDRLRPRRAARAHAADPHPQLRLARRRAQRPRHVPAGLRHPAGPQVPLERLGDDLDHRRRSSSSRSSSSGRHVNKREPLVPLKLFRDRNFSISNFAISTMSFTATAMGFPLMLYAQLVRGDSPLVASLLLVPMAVVSIILAPIVGRFTDRVHPRILTGAGFAITALSIYLLSRSLTASGSGLRRSSARWPCWASAWPASGRHWPRPPPATCRCSMAGAGSGVYNATRQVGAVLGSAAIAVLLDARLAANGLSGGQSAEGGVVHQLPAIVRAPFSAAMSQTLLLPVGVLLLGFVVGDVLRAAAPPGRAHRDRRPGRPEEPAPAAAGATEHDR